MSLQNVPQAGVVSGTTENHIACMRLLQQTFGYIARQSGWIETLEAWQEAGGDEASFAKRPSARFEGSYVPVIRSEPFTQAEAVLECAMLHGDIDATKAACRQIWTLVIGHMRT